MPFFRMLSLKYQKSFYVLPYIMYNHANSFCRYKSFVSTNRELIRVYVSSACIRFAHTRLGGRRATRDMSIPHAIWCQRPRGSPRDLHSCMKIRFVDTKNTSSCQRLWVSPKDLYTCMKCQFVDTKNTRDHRYHCSYRQTLILCRV